MAVGIAQCPGSRPGCGRHASASGSDADEVLETVRELAPDRCPYCREDVVAVVDEEAGPPATLTSNGVGTWGGM